MATKQHPEEALPSLTHNTHAMVADAGEVLRPPPLLLRLLHWPMPPLALPPLKRHGGWGGRCCSGPRRAGGCCAQTQQHNLCFPPPTHNEVAPPARRPYMGAACCETRSGYDVYFRQASPASHRLPPACSPSFWRSLPTFCYGLNAAAVDKSYRSATEHRRRDYMVYIRAGHLPSRRIRVT